MCVSVYVRSSACELCVCVSCGPQACPCALRTHQFHARVGIVVSIVASSIGRRATPNPCAMCTLVHSRLGIHSSDIVKRARAPFSIDVSARASVTHRVRIGPFASPPPSFIVRAYHNMIFCVCARSYRRLPFTRA